jgi:3-oxosteroid 1-dehydrogenase
MSTNGTWDEVADLVIVGSGGGSMCAALAAKRLGKRALIVEKQALVGGSTGFSGGVWWVPNNAVMKRAGPASISTPWSTTTAPAPRRRGVTPSSAPVRRWWTSSNARA